MVNVMKQSWQKIVTRIIDVVIVVYFVVMLYSYFIGPIFGEAKPDASEFSRPLFIIAAFWWIKQFIKILTIPRISQNEMTWYYLGISLISGASLLFETTMTRIFAVAFFNHLAFLIISTALFGLGFSGVILSIFPSIYKFDRNKVLMILSICFSVSAIITLKIVVEVPLRFSSLQEQTIQLAYLGIYYLALAVPFFFCGMVVASLLSQIPQRVNRLYFSDLIGAGLGCLSVLVLIPKLGASGAVIIAALLGIAASACFARQIGKNAVLVSVVFFLGIGLLLPNSETWFRVNVHEKKRSFANQEETGEVEFSKWGPISRIDVAKFHQDKIIWIDGGSNQGFMKPFNGDLKSLKPDHRAGLVYSLVKDPDVLIVGPAGGEEVIYALSHRPKSITGVELDPVIVDIVQNEYRRFIGRIFSQPNVTLVNDEGRSYIRRSPKKFDIIQQINNASPAAIASGAINISETYLITVEAFHEYLDHLNEGGYVFIRRWGSLRLAVVATQALRERGVEHPEEQIVIISDPDPHHSHPAGRAQFFGQFYLKNGTFTEEELNVFRKPNVYKDIIYGPRALNVQHPEYAEYQKLLASPDVWKQYYDEKGIDLSPVTDNRPFFNHFTKFGQFTAGKDMAEFQSIFQYYSNTDFPLIIILAEAALLSLVFIILPLYIFKRSGLRSRGKFRFLLYFGSLGLAFILIEIVLIQKFTLFMGNPTYSVTIVLFSILTFAGCGSFLTDRFHQHLKPALAMVIFGILLLCWIEMTFGPVIFNACLHYSTPVRILISILMLAPLGMLMGMPFPLGITFTNQIAQRLIPWVWGINGYATVIGSVLCVIFALMFGFKAVVFVACMIYLIGLAAITSIKP